VYGETDDINYDQYIHVLELSLRNDYSEMLQIVYRTKLRHQQ
jgi:hypothetical protein